MIFSKINELLKPLVARKEQVTRKGRNEERKSSSRKGSMPAGDEPSDDVALMSIEALRRMVQEMGEAKMREELLATLARLEHHGIRSIPVREEQSVWSALEDARRFL